MIQFCITYSYVHTCLFFSPTPVNSSPGFSVYQLTLVEVDHNGTDTPSGVVLALVGSCREDECSQKDVESTKSLRMYSLSSIISLAKWAASSQVTSSSPLYRLDS